MVSTMFRTMQEFDPEFPGCREEGGQGERSMVSSSESGNGMLVDAEDGFVAESKIESAAAACVLWSTVGMGCLIGGRPKSSVSRRASRALFVAMIIPCIRTSIAVVPRQTGEGRRGWCL